MKKLITASIAGVIIASGVANLKAEAASVNLFSKGTVAKAKAGKLTVGGLKVGQKLSYYNGKKGFNVQYNQGLVIGSKATAYANFQKNKPTSAKKISVVRIPSFNNYSIKKVRSIYGTPLYTQKNLGAANGTAIVEYYKNISFVYYKNIEWKSGYTLAEVHLLNNPNKKTSQAFAKIYKKYNPYLTNTNAIN